MANAYTPNNLVRLSVAFTLGGTPTNPTTVTAKVKDPSGTITTYASPTNDSTGNYHQDITVSTLPGKWWYSWIGTGTVVAEAEGYLVIVPTETV